MIQYTTEEHLFRESKLIFYKKEGASKNKAKWRNRGQLKLRCMLETHPEGLCE
jgi:hypothetical protein